jgi:hypothetical protein
MRQATIISVTPDRQLEIPPEIQAQLNPGDEYVIWATDDAIVYKKIQKAPTYSALLKKIEALGPDPEEMSLEEISALVKEVRQEMAQHESAT